MGVAISVAWVSIPVLGAFAFLSQASMVWAEWFWLSEPILRAYHIGGLCVVALAVLLASHIAWRCKRSLENWSFVTFLTLLALSVALEDRLNIDWYLNIEPFPVSVSFSTVSRFHQPLYAGLWIGMLVCGIAWAVRFPADTRLDGRDERIILRAITRAGSSSWTALLFLAGFALFNLTNSPSVALVLGLCTAAGAMIVLRGKFHSGDDDLKRRLKWVVQAVLSAVLFLIPAVVVEVLVHTYDSTDPLVLWIHALILPLGFLTTLTFLGVAVVYEGSISPDLTIRRTSIYGTLVLIFIFLLAGIGNLAENWVEGGLGLPGGVGTIITGGTIALVLIPVKRRMDGVMNRLLPVTALAHEPTRFVAVLFSDIVGYTRLTGDDQKAALTMMTVFHKTAARNAREHRGRVVKTNADEVMLEFKDPTNAVRAASELRAEFHEAALRQDLPTPEICTGIHYGEVTRSREGDLFGDAVNVASRIHGLAEPGQVMLSAAVKDRLEEGAFEMGGLGPRKLKNVSEPVEVFSLTSRTEGISF